MPKKEELFTMTGLAQWLNDNFECKKTKKPFTFSDVQQYIRIGHLPKYLGGYKIEKSDSKYNKLIKVIIEEDDLV